MILAWLQLEAGMAQVFLMIIPSLVVQILNFGFMMCLLAVLLQYIIVNLIQIRWEQLIHQKLFKNLAEIHRQ